MLIGAPVLGAKKAGDLWGDFMEVSLHRHDWLNNWPFVMNSIYSPSPLLQVCAKSSKLLIKVWSFWQLAPVLQLSRSSLPSLTLLACQINSITHEIPRVLGDRQKWRERGDKISVACLEPKQYRGSTIEKWSQDGRFRSTPLQPCVPHLTQVLLLFWAWDTSAVREKGYHGWLTWFFPAGKFITSAVY